jgi:predicted PurR-regulated permease PerM
VRQVNQLRQELIQFVAYLDTISTDTVSVMGFNLVVGDIVAEVTDTLRTVLSEFGTSAFNVVFGAAEVLLLTIFTFLIGFYLTRDSEKVKDWLTGIIPPDYRSDVLNLVAEVDKVWSAFFRGQVILAVVVGVLLTLVASVLGLPQPALLGILGGLMEFLPSVGHAIWLITASILALIEGSSTLPVSNGVLLLIVVAVHTAYTQFDLNYLIPRIIGRQVHLHPMVVIIGIIVGASLGGVLGVALAAPTIASARILGRYLYARLFDLDPFPMVGPPSAPRPVRERQEAALDASDGPTTTLRSVMQRARRQSETETPEEPV